MSRHKEQNARPYSLHPEPAVPPRRMAEAALAVALTSAVFQFFEIVPFVPLSMWWLLLSIPAVISMPVPRWPALAALTLALGNVVVSFWSPVPVDAIRMGANFVALAVACALALVVASAGETRLVRPLALAAPALALQSTCTAIFFLLPDIERQYFDSVYAPYLSSGSVKLLFTTGFNNVVFPEKAGGFFLNGNTASMFMAMSAWLYFGLGVKLRQRWMMAFAVVPLGGAIATGSKTALLLAGTSVLVVCLLTVVRRNVVAGFAIAMLVPLAGLFAISALASAEAFSRDTVATVGSRGRIWELAISTIARDPILGVGYGGWFNVFRNEGGFIGFNERPAHNLFLQAWLDGGAVYVLMIAAFALVCVVVGLRALRAAQSGREALASAAVLMSVMWVFAHGLADNTWVYGDWHSLPYFGVAVAVLAMWARGESVSSGKNAAGTWDDAPQDPRPLVAAGAPQTQAIDRNAREHGVDDNAGRAWRCSASCPFDHSRPPIQ